MEPLIEMTNAAAGQDDRWLFIASLMVLGCFAVATMRYFIRQHERLIEDHKKVRDEYQRNLRQMLADQCEANAKLMVCLENNTRVLEECREVLRSRP